MQLRLPFRVDYYLVGSDAVLRLSSLLRLFQEAAIRHADARGFGGPDMARKGWGWVLYKLEVEVSRYPHFGEEVEVVTRLGGWKGMKAYRHFGLFRKEECLARGLSVWFLLDAVSRRPLHLGEELFSSVRSEPGFPPPVPAGEWKPGRDFTAQRELEITSRWSDIDTNGHVNNTAYADFVESALARDHRFPGLKNFRIQYNHEISREVGAVRVAWAVSGDRCFFRVSDPGRVCAVGDGTLLPPEERLPARSAFRSLEESVNARRD